MFKQALVTLSIIVSCSFGMAWASTSSTKAILVETSPVQYTSYQQTLNTTGTLIAIPGLIVRSEVAGRVSKIFFQSGQQIIKGDPLVELNSDVIQAQLAQARATEKLAETNFGRYKKLFKMHYFSAADFDKIKTTVLIAEAKIKELKARLRQLLIIAPFSGDLGLSKINVGDYVDEGQTIVNLQSINPIYVDFSIPENDISKVKLGQDVLVRSDAYLDEVFKGEVIAHESEINQANRTLIVRASISNNQKKLLPGSFVEVTLLLAAPQKVIAIPKTAVIYTADGNYIYTVKNNKAKKIKVTLGNKENENIIIKSGLKAGDILVTAGQQKLSDGALVTISVPH